MVANSVTCSAPGSTILMGEHAVLHGYPALVAALDTRLYVTLSALNNDELHIESSVGSLQSHIPEVLTASIEQQPLRFVLAVLQCFSSNVRTLSGLHIKIDSGIDPTMGLGSSAALVVALVAAMRTWLQLGAEKHQVLADAVSIIRHVQGRGSGADAAASCYGGLVRYDANAKQAQALLSQNDSAGYQDLPALRLIYTGYKTPTPKVVALVEQWEQAEPERYERIYAAMGSLVATAETAIKSMQWATLARTMNDYQQQMQALGVCDAGTQAAIDAAWQQVALEGDVSHIGIKISGSGMGDCILGLGVPTVTTWPHQQFALHISPQGLSCS